jgi:Fe-S-cluster containining protein
MNIVSQVMALYADLDRQVATFQLESGIRCLPQCGRCCPVADIFTTVLEMLPLAGEILRQGTAEKWLTRIALAAALPGCVLYQSDLPENADGHCGFYPWRPSVCRLFGFASVRTRGGERNLAACKWLKAASPEIVSSAGAHAAKAPRFSDVGALLYAIDPAAGSRLMPINEALQRAIQWMGLWMQMSYGEGLGVISAA